MSARQAVESAPFPSEVAFDLLQHPGSQAAVEDEELRNTSIVPRQEVSRCVTTTAKNEFIARGRQVCDAVRVGDGTSGELGAVLEELAVRIGGWVLQAPTTEGGRVYREGGVAEGLVAIAVNNSAIAMER